MRVGVFALYRRCASKPLGIKASKELDPGSATFDCFAAPRLPGRKVDVYVDVLGEVVGKGIQERAVLIVRHFYFAKVFKIVGAVVDSTIDHHFSSGVVPIECLMSCSSGFSLRFFLLEVQPQ